MSRRSKSDWPALINEYRRSGETQRSFCLRRKLSVSTMQYHLKRSSAQVAEVVTGSAGFIELSPPTAGERLELELTFPNGSILRLRG